MEGKVENSPGDINLVKELWQPFYARILLNEDAIKITANLEAIYSIPIAKTPQIDDPLIANIASLAIMEQCPRFQSCSAPICPPDFLQDQRIFLESEPTCSLPRSRRFKIGENTILPQKGMTKSEWAAHVRWERLVRVF